jgi:polysaccharide export outer membrane protein
MKSNVLQAILKHMGRLCIFWIICWLTCATAIAEEVNGHIVYRLGSGDHIKITIYGEPNLSGEFEVDGSGRVSLPLVGEVQAAGQGLREFEETVAAAFRDGYLVDPRVRVEMLNYRPFYILGEVSSPGKYPYVQGMTVLYAVAMAGGYTHRARHGLAEIVRAGEPNSLTTKSPETTLVMPGDVIRIPERFF